MAWMEKKWENNQKPSETMKNQPNYMNNRKKPSKTEKWNEFDEYITCNYYLQIL